VSALRAAEGLVKVSKESSKRNSKIENVENKVMRLKKSGASDLY
jgi:hypothetical protein